MGVVGITRHTSQRQIDDFVKQARPHTDLKIAVTTTALAASVSPMANSASFIFGSHYGMMDAVQISQRSGRNHTDVAVLILVPNAEAMTASRCGLPDSSVRRDHMKRSLSFISEDHRLYPVLPRLFGLDSFDYLCLMVGIFAM